jgi:alanyl-tRNA synthetase
MKHLSTAEIRRTFLDFFKARGHEEVASSSLVPANDPTLLFTNSGMVQFKDVFTGTDKRSYTRATTAQKCVRAGGKHNDLENVGYTPRHHTFFEMMGNFSFGDYFKKDAIQFAWTLITEALELPKERLCVTIFKGEDGIPADEEAADLWAQVGVPRERIFRLGKKDNFWQMGDTGPQGPCTEIHFFLPADTHGMLDQKRVEESLGWMEIWNLVFMQFVRETKDGPLNKLPKPSVDTGAGLERLALVLQNKSSTYETDGFRVLLDRIAGSAGKKYTSTDHEDDISMRVIADHSRATAFLIADGVQPSNEGRGYVLRRIMRRAIRHGKRLGFDELFFHQACKNVIDLMSDAYPELTRNAALIEKVASHEEESFRRTLDRGLRLLTEEIGQTQKDVLEPKFVAVLYDTYGFPIDLTRVIANENGKTVDEDAANQAVKELQSHSGGGELTKDKAVDKLWFGVRDTVGATKFLGYETETAKAKVKAIVRGKEQHGEAKAGDEVEVVLDTTPFYGESGGQAGDVGHLSWPGGKMEVKDTQKPLAELHVHVGQISLGTLKVGDEVEAVVDGEARGATRKNHSATHLLHLALKEILGAHVQQKGSLVAPDRLRFDFSHFESLTQEQQRAIEDRVNRMILKNAPTQVAVGSMKDAQEAGAVMLFGEKYGDRVRMVRIGQDSLELCGGTHVHQAGDIGLFKIVAEGGLASGVRRLEAVTGLNALRWAQDKEQLLRTAAGVLKTAPEQLPERLDKLMKRQKELERDLEKAQAKAAMGGGGEGPAIEEFAGVRVIFKSADGTPAKSLRGLSDQLRDQLKSGVVVLSAKEGDKVNLVVALTKDLEGKVHAGDLVKAATSAMGGSGGGRGDFAQGGGPADQLPAGLAALRAKLSA